MSDEYEIMIAEAEHIFRKLESGNHAFKLQMVSIAFSFPGAVEVMREIVESRDRIAKMKRERRL